MQTIIVKTQDGDFLGFIETDADIETVNEIIEGSFNKDNYNYDIEAFIEDIESSGFTAERTYLEEVEI